MRYLPLSEADRGEMLARIGVAKIDDLFADVPADALLAGPPDLPRRKGKLEVERILARLAGRNIAASSVPFFVGAGAYKHHVPASGGHRAPPPPPLPAPPRPAHPPPRPPREPARPSPFPVGFPAPGRDPCRHGGRE